jgi:hypothetical protein
VDQRDGSYCNRKNGANRATTNASSKNFSNGDWEERQNFPIQRYL